MKRREFIKAAGAVAGSAIAGGCVPGSNAILSSVAAAGQPNILLVMTDQQSADAMSCRMGTRFINTPAMDSLAARGVSFTRAYTPNPLCVPARTSIFTGRPAHVTGFQTNDLKISLAGKYRCLGAYFRDAGYDTGYLGKWHLPFSAGDPSVHGFDFMESIRNNGVDPDIPAPAAAFLKRKREKPFLLVTSFVNPHNICEWARDEELKDGAIGRPPSPEKCPPAVENLAPPADEADGMLLMRRSYQSTPRFPVGNFDENKWRQYRWAYFRMIELVDARIGVILSALRDTGRLDDTLIVFACDHGDCQGAHGWNQKTVLYDNVSRVPLIIVKPGGGQARLDQRLVNTGTDILPTLLDFAGISIPGDLPGLSLKSSAQAAITDPRRYVVSEVKMAQGGAVDGRVPELSGRMVRSRNFKYCAYDIGTRRESLFDMERDPGETVNLAGRTELRQEVERHRQYLAEWCRLTGDSFELPGQNLLRKQTKSKPAFLRQPSARSAAL